MNTAPLLVELFVEELPPKALQKLGDAFAGVLRDQLVALELADASAQLTAYASPRRLAAHLSAVRAQAPDKAISQKLMPVSVGLDASGQATPALLKKLSAHVPGGIFQFTLEPQDTWRFIYASEGMRDIYEIELGMLQKDARTVLERIHPMDLERVRASIRLSALQMSHWREEYRVQLPQRGLRWIRGEATPEELPGGGTLWHGYVSDISDLKRVEEELRALSITDSLTGIYNRRYFQDRLKGEMLRLNRMSGALSLIMLDIDHFKRINDQHGHAVGDVVLQELCKRIGQRLRRTDIFCRIGGEECVVLCPNTDGAQAYSLAMQLWQSLRDAAMEPVGVVTASFGVAESLAVPPSLNTSSRLILREAPPFLARTPVAISHTPPQPTMIATYCSPPMA